MVKFIFYVNNQPHEATSQTGRFEEALNQINSNLLTPLNHNNSLFTDAEAFVDYTALSSAVEGKDTVHVIVSPKESKGGSGLSRGEIYGALKADESLRESFAAFCHSSYGKHYTNLNNETIQKAFDIHTRNNSQSTAQGTSEGAVQTVELTVEQLIDLLDAELTGLDATAYEFDEVIRSFNNFKEEFEYWKNTNAEEEEDEEETSSLPQEILDKIAFVRNNHPNAR